MSYSGWTDEKIAERNAESGTNLNRVEVDVLCAIRDGYETRQEVAVVTGYTPGQVAHAVGVLQAQGMAAPEGTQP